ncbi:polycystic kidney disease protein 1-like 2 isoform X1 [Alosa sapidissima]|uniref:polycystic kidney disease protein 1-like 2 isoform X1 n=2 Tax=Alosa sapidissima TaxID=34773 RepID=UPI001C098A63|nr:polycystic kidney disease protein 1-like 2 isoform X1 [Alosa sapidissima]
MVKGVLAEVVLLAILHIAATRGQDPTEALGCPEHQEPFDGSCYEFVAQQRAFQNAQRWCERGGGHLAFILNDETQQFLQRHIQPQQDWWIGLAPASSNLTLDSAAAEGTLSWLDGSDVSYSNWASEPSIGARCGYILQGSGFQWEATDNCTQEMHFACEFETGKSMACANYNATLQCGSGQVIEVDDSFFGRKTIHYCQGFTSSSITSSQEECSWVDVVHLVEGQCHGLQACQALADASSFGEPCPGLGSYLSVEYHCKDGLHLLMGKLAAVFDNVTIQVKWLLHPFQGNLTCTLIAGDGHIIDPYIPDESQASVVHQYSYPGVFTVGVECTTSEWHVTAQKTITIQEPLGEYGVVKCYSMGQPMNSTNCKAFANNPLTIQVKLDAGSNVTYKVQRDGTLLASSSAAVGIVPHNITLGPEEVQSLGPGCHRLTLLASNNVTAADPSTALEVCVLDPVQGLQASVSTQARPCPEAYLHITVSLDYGAPAQLLFQISDSDNNTVQETREVDSGSLQVFNISTTVQGMIQVKVKAWNAFSATDQDAGNTTVLCLPEIELLSNDAQNSTEEHLRIPRASVNIQMDPNKPNIGDPSVELEINGHGNSDLHWECIGNCICSDTSNEKKIVIPKKCLQKPFEYVVYSLTVTKKTGNKEVSTATKCVTLTPRREITVIIHCQDCNSINILNDLNLKVDCPGCQTIVWLIEDTSPVPAALSSCYSNGEKRFREVANSVSSWAVPAATLQSAQQLITVIVYGTKDTGGGNIESGYSEFGITLPTPGASSVTTPSTVTAASTVTTPSSVTIASSVTTSASVTSSASPGTTASPPSVLSCWTNRTAGDVLSPFTFTCSVTQSFCSLAPCTYCLNTASGNYLYCGNNPSERSLFLPLGDRSNDYTLTVVVTLQNSARQTLNTTILVKVRDSVSESSVQDLQNLVSNQVAELQSQGQFTGAALAQMYQTVSSALNGGYNDEDKSARKELREQMVTNMFVAIESVPMGSPEEVQAVASAVAELTKQDDELTTDTQIQASSILSKLSKSLNSLPLPESNVNEKMLEASKPLIEAASNIIVVSAATDKQNEISEHLLSAVDNVQSALLVGKKTSHGPTVITTPQISLYVNRMSPKNLVKQPFTIQNSSSSSASFAFPPLGLSVVSSTPVDVRMMTFETNPFCWNTAQSINGTVGALSLTQQNGSLIPVANLTNEIEIFLPRQLVAEVNSTFLDLGNFSTIVINVTSPNVSLVLKLDPSEDVSLHLLIGFQEYPNDTHYEAQTYLPHDRDTQEERYTWVLSPRDMTIDEGVYYLLVRPVVGAGVNSTKVTVSITSIAAQCVYWDELKLNWSDYGCRVGPLTTPLVTQCLCNHLTFFGSSFFVMPNVVDVSQTAQLFSTFVNNPVVVCFVGAIFLAYLVVVIWARRKDIQDTAKVKITVLGDNDPLAEYRYLLNISTGHRRGASTSSQVTVTLLGTEGESEPHHLTDPDKPVFERGGVDMFLLTTPFSLGELQSIRLWHDNSGNHPGWYINKVMVQDIETGQKWHFLCSSWLAIDMGECVLDKVFPVAREMDLKKFSNLFYMKTVKDFRDGHIWFSVVSRPANSNFTCVQRVSCCFSLLLCTMLTSIMFYGVPTDPAEQTMDLGHIEFTWQQVMIGVQSSIIMFPINLLIVSIFRNTRPRERKSKKPVKDKSKADTCKQAKSGRVSPTQPPSPQSQHRDITPEAVTKDIRRIAQSLSKVMKNPLPRIDVTSGKNPDINTLLSLVEDIIRQQNRAGDMFYTDSSKFTVTLEENPSSESPKKTSSDGQKGSLHSQYLYRQLQHVEKDLGLLGPERFSNPDSYSQAVQQVRGMKGLLEPHLSSTSNGDHPSRSPSPEDSAEGGDSSGGKRCCQGGLPWWFVFLGWLLVAATSGVSAFFTMLYGLKYGKERSVNWLISMLVSFFESLFITQPLKVLGFAVFFALVLKKVDQEEYGDVPIEESVSNTGDPDAVRIARRDSTCSFYQPPPPSDIERMRMNMIKEQKVFALIREILIYMGFMWMLLLVAYSQRDPNAFYLTRHIQQSFSSGITDSMSHKEVFTWANTSLLNNIFGQYPGFITDGNSKLIGNARLRQVRVQKDSCRIARSMELSVTDCHAPYSWEIEDRGSYGPGWNRTRDTNTSQAAASWQYLSQSRLRAHPIWGNVALYRGGGFVVELGPDLTNATSALQYLFDNRWLDVYTRAIFAEFTVYNANINLFCIATLMLETTAVGAFQYRSEIQTVRLYQSTGGLHIFVMASEVIYFLFILYYMYVQGKLMRQQKWAYFKTKWNLLELAIIILSWSALSVFIKRTLLGNRDLELYQNNKDQYISFHETATVDAVLGYLIAFLVLLSTIKLWHLLRLNPKLHLITSTLQRAWTDISGFLLVMTIMFLAYSIACNLMYGWKLSSYRTLINAAQTMVSLQLGIFNYEEVLDYNPVLGAFLIGSCIIFMTFVVLNLFISVILVAFSEEQLHHKPSEEEEIVDLMLMKFCSLFGIKIKKKGEASGSFSATNNPAPSVIS